MKNASCIVVALVGSVLPFGLKSSASEPISDGRNSALTCLSHSERVRHVMKDRLPGSTPLTNSEFSRKIIGMRFLYKDFDSGITINLPVERFFPDGQYSLHGSRSDIDGTYVFNDGVVSISSERQFLTISKKRLFLIRTDGAIFMADCSPIRRLFELVPVVSDKGE